MRTPLASHLASLFILPFFALLPTASAQAPSPAVAVPDASIMELWAGMHAAGMIDDAQFEHVQEQGILPPDTTVQNSPLPAEQQTVWMGMQQHGLVTADELVHMLFEGTTPNLSADEVKAFEELAPVYEPDRSKRLTYDVRLKHQRVEAIRLKHQAAKEWQSRYDAAVTRAQAEGLPLRVENEEGQVELLFAYDHDRPLYALTCNRNAAATISTDTVRPGGSGPFGLTGTNITAAMWDVGAVRTSHQEFAVARVAIGDTATEAEHSTRVAGTLAATGISTDAQGMAYRAKVLSYDLYSLIPEMTDCLVSNEHVRISNHSYVVACGWDNVNAFWWIYTWFPRWWGDIRLSEDEDYLFGFYNYLPHDMDEFCYTATYHLPVYAAGNDRDDRHLLSTGYPSHYVRVWPAENWVSTSRLRPNDGNPAGFDCITPHGVAKNILTVGAILDVPDGYTNGATVTLDWYSATGPTDDGRIKPDLVANGQSLYTTSASSDAGYVVGSGTSYASPSVAGSLVLLQDLHERIYGADAPMLASTLKGLVIHTADDVGMPGPDYQFGWGLMNTLAAAWVITNNAIWDSLPHIKEVSLVEDEYVEFGSLASTNEPLKVTMCWTDPAGPIQDWALDPTNRILVNDLDLRVISPDGTETNAPWILDPQNPTNAATAGDNCRDNVEQVLILTPTNGWYTVHVEHKGTLSNGVQDVTIIVTGNTPTNAPDFFMSSIERIDPDTNLWVQLQWPGVVGALYQVDTVTNLMNPNDWTNRSEVVSANLETMDWTEQDIELDEVRFYRLHRLK